MRHPTGRSRSTSLRLACLAVPPHLPVVEVKTGLYCAVFSTAAVATELGVAWLVLIYGSDKAPLTHPHMTYHLIAAAPLGVAVPHRGLET